MSVKALLLAAGYGTRLEPLTDTWPKCLMPINGKPLLEIWLDSLIETGIEGILVNVHHHKAEVIDFLSREKFKNKISWVEENFLLGTAGTLIKNADFFKNDDVLLIHSDNLCNADLASFIAAHKERSKDCLMTMMTFICSNPSLCGIVEVDQKGICIKFHEKVKNPPSKLANGAIYLIDNKVLKNLQKQNNITDFSLDVIPSFLGKIQTWKNSDIHLDIGSIKNLVDAQNLDIKNKNICFDNWHKLFIQKNIHKELENLMRITNE